MNNKAHLRPSDYDSNGDIIPMSWKEEKGDTISRSALKEDIRKRLCISSLEYLTEQEKVIVEEIDNAPTVKPCDNCDLYFKAMTKEEMKKGGAE